MKKCQWCGKPQDTSRTREGLHGLTCCDDCVRDESERIIAAARDMSEAMRCMSASTRDMSKAMRYMSAATRDMSEAMRCMSEEFES